MQSEHRIDPGGTPGRGVAGEECNSGEEKRHAAKYDRIYGANTEEQALQSE